MHAWCRACRSDRNAKLPRFPPEPARGPRICSCCMESLPVEAFSRNGHQPSGLKLICKLCMKKKDRARRLKLIESRVYIPMTTKRCPTCKVVKEVSEYSRNSYRADGLQHSCKGCCKLQHKEVRKRMESQTKVSSRAPTPKRAAFTWTYNS